jgi:DNA-binding PadR family transcriptional regulator
MSLQFAVLGVLEARPMTGYDLTRFFESTARWVWSAPQSQIYPLLRKLHDDGLIAADEQTRGERLRRVEYTPTAAGLSALREWLSVTHDEPPVRDPLLLQSLFFDMIDPVDADRVLSDAIASLRLRIEQWVVHRERLRARDTPLLVERLRHRPASDHQRIAEIKAHVFDHLIDSAELRIAWAERMREIVGVRAPSETRAP